MSRFMLLDRGEELSALTAARVRNASAGLALRLLDDAPPLREGQIIHVSPRKANDGRARGIVLCQRADDFRLSSNGTAPAAVLGRVVAVQRGPAKYAIDRGLLALAFGSPHALLAAVRDKYGRAGEVYRYSSLTIAAAEAFELELVARHVRPGGLILDIGCGAGREAIGFVRAGFRVVGIDIAPAMVDASRRNALSLGLTMDFKIQSATDLDEPSDTYDGAFFSGSFQHVPGRALRVDTLRRISRSLKPDGALILAVTYREPLGLLSRTRLVDVLRVVGTKISGDARFGEPGDGYMRDVSDASDSREPI
ncbi:MAG: class I SAM-dependent methyltransferase, partial [Actinobacteria bacterium]